MSNVDKWFISNNRWWSREQNIAHARYMLSHAKTAQEQSFWQLILERLDG